MKQETNKPSLSKPSLSKPKVRPAQIEDFNMIYPLLKEINSKRLQRDDWFSLFQNHWSLDEFSPGMVLEVNAKIVGYLGTIYSRQIIDGQSRVVCNLSSWIVMDEYRSHSIMMLFPLLRKKNLILTSFSSNNVTYKLYNKLGFKDGNMSKRIIYSIPFMRRKLKEHYQLIIEPLLVAKVIGSKNKALFDDHKRFRNTCVLIKFQGKECLLMGVTRKKCFKLYFASDSQFLQIHLKEFCDELMSQLNVKKMIVDEMLLDNTALFLSRKISQGNPYQYKASDVIQQQMTAEYSEMFLLSM